jgi:glycosyltransferase involved in cell wall biosynthesis
MKILILSFYFPPDLSAGSFRMKALVTALQKVTTKPIQIDIMTTMPNRYSTMVSAAAEYEEADGLSIRRIALPSHKSGMVDQSKAFITFARAVLKETQKGDWDIVFATSSRLMTAVLGSRVASRANIPLYLDIRDLFTDTMSDLLADSKTRLMIPGFRWLEKRTLKKAERVNLVSAGFLAHAKAIAPKHDYRLFTNGIDEEFLTKDFSNPNKATDSLPLVLYAGNMGEGQGLHNIIPKTAHMFDGKARFRLIGGGGRRTELENAIKDAGVANVEIINPIPREELLAHYREADILFLHLNDHDAFRKVLPSKIFEYASIKKPILAGVSGYAAEFLNKEVPGSKVFLPCDSEGMAKALNYLLSETTHFDREIFCENFARTKIMEDMAEDILAFASEVSAK